ncbi:MAG: CoA-binding protein [Chloroflexota bacterium]|nr:CoA-binding protein [Chloroflexota bacterium]
MADDATIADLLRRARRIAIVGASPQRGRPSHGVMRYLLDAGYECVPVNPNAASVQGRRSFPNLQAAVAESGPFDIVDVFRRSEYASEVARDALSSGADALWLQLGVVNWTAAEIAHDGGLLVVMDRCTAIEHRRLRGA